MGLLPSIPISTPLRKASAASFGVIFPSFTRFISFCPSLFCIAFSDIPKVLLLANLIALKAATGAKIPAANDENICSVGDAPFSLANCPAPPAAAPLAVCNAGLDAKDLNEPSAVETVGATIAPLSPDNLVAAALAPCSITLAADFANPVPLKALTPNSKALSDMLGSLPVSVMRCKTFDGIYSDGIFLAPTAPTPKLNSSPTPLNKEAGSPATPLLILRATSLTTGNTLLTATSLTIEAVDGLCSTRSKEPSF